MKRFFYIAFCLLLLTSCQIAKPGGGEPEQTTGAAPSEAVPPDTAPLLPIVELPVGLRFADAAYNSSIPRDFIYNPDDDCYYISLCGEAYPSWAGENLPWSPPEIEQFCRIDAQTYEITVLSDAWVGNLVYCEGYVYFYDGADGGKIMRSRDDVIEEVFVFYDHSSRNDTVWYGDFFVEGGYLYIMFRWADEQIRVFDLDTLTELPDRHHTAYFGARQILNGTIYSLTADGLQWKEGAGAIQTYPPAADLIRQYYGTGEFPWIDSFLYHEVLLVNTNQDLFLIRPETDEIERIARNVYNRYTLHDGTVYYCTGDMLYAYSLATRESVPVISYYEGIYENDIDDYSGFENIARVKFLNDRCFLYMDGWRTYSHSRVAELDLNSKTTVYLTDRFNPKVNRMTSSASGLISYEYPNGYSVFNDYGSGGGTLISNYEQRICININPIGYLFGARAVEDTERASKLLTRQGLTLYYVYGVEGDHPISALIMDGETIIDITVSGELAVIKDNEDELFGILQSIYIHPA